MGKLAYFEIVAFDGVNIITTLPLVDKEQPVIICEAFRVRYIEKDSSNFDRWEVTRSIKRFASVYYQSQQPKQFAIEVESEASCKSTG